MFFIPSWAIGVAVIIIAAQISKAIFGGRPRRGPPENEAALGELRQNLDAMQTRVSELEERVAVLEENLRRETARFRRAILLSDDFGEI